MAQAVARGSLLRFAPRSPRLKLSPPQRRALNQRTVAEFFAGIGLMRLALQNQGWQVVFANDMAAEKRQMYVDEFGEERHLFVAPAVITCSAAA